MLTKAVPKPVLSFQLVKRGLINKRTMASFKCPHCSEPLVAGEEEASASDTCPHCGGEFLLNSKAVESLANCRARDEQKKLKEASDKIAQIAAAKQGKAELHSEQAAARAEAYAEQVEEQNAQQRWLQEKSRVAGKQSAAVKAIPVRSYSGLEFIASLMVVASIFAFFAAVMAFASVIGLVMAPGLLVSSLFLMAGASCVHLLINIAQDVERTMRHTVASKHE